MPASVNSSLRVDLVSSFVPTNVSRSLTLRVSVATGMRNFLAAAEKLPSSTEDTSIAMACSRSKLLTKKEERSQVYVWMMDRDEPPFLAFRSSWRLRSFGFS